MKKKKSREIWKKTGHKTYRTTFCSANVAHSLQIVNNIIDRKPKEKERMKNNG